MISAIIPRTYAQKARYVYLILVYRISSAEINVMSAQYVPIKFSVFRLANGSRDLFEFSEPVHKGWECWRWIPEEPHLSVDGELYHEVCIDSLVKRFCWEYSKTL
jgi:hypothetical protein